MTEFDNRTMIERSQATAEGIIGRERTPDEFVRDFAKQDIHTRVAMLDTYKVERSGEVTLGGARKEAAELAIVRRLRVEHDRLRRAGR